jgi:GNAT superfamily N-acetyltransferase
MSTTHTSAGSTGRETGRLKRAVQQHGFAETVSRASRLALSEFYRRETHVWYELDLAGERADRDSPEGMRLLRAERADLPLIEQLPSIGLGEASRRYRDGVILWLVLDGRHVAFACWIFFDEMPVYAAKGGALRLPPGVVGLEDSVTSAAHRGRGVAPWAWSQIADHLAEAGVAAIITKVSLENTASRRAGEKSGFCKIASMSLRKIGPSRNVAVGHSGNGVSPFLASSLTR